MNDLPIILADLLSGKDQEAEQAVRRLPRLGEGALGAFCALLKDPDPDHRWWATRALAEFDLAGAIEGLLVALDDSDASVRQCAALGLRHRPSAKAIPTLIGALSDPDRLFARLAGDALSALGPEAITALQAASQAQEPQARIEAVRALAGTRHVDAIPALFDALEDESTLVNYWAEEGLDRLGVGMVFLNP